MLRSIESKLGGIALALVFVILLWLPTYKISSGYSVGRQVVFWWGVMLFIALSYLGGCHPEYPYSEISKLFSLGLVLLVAVFKGF